MPLFLPNLRQYQDHTGDIAFLFYLVDGSHLIFCLVDFSLLLSALLRPSPLAISSYLKCVPTHHKMSLHQMSWPETKGCECWPGQDSS